MPIADGLFWPAGKPLAISLSVMLEGWADGSAPGIGPMGNPLKPGVADLQALSWAEYGPKVGAWRLLDLLEREQVRAVFYTSGVVAERYPELPAAITGRGHVVAAHGWSQGTPARLSDRRRRARRYRALRRGIAAHGRTAAGRLAESALHAECAYLATIGACGVPLARRHVRRRSTISHRYA